MNIIFDFADELSEKVSAKFWINTNLYNHIFCIIQLYIYIELKLYYKIISF